MPRVRKSAYARALPGGNRDLCRMPELPQRLAARDRRRQSHRRHYCSTA